MLLTPFIILVFNITNGLPFFPHFHYSFSFKSPVLAAAPDIPIISYIYILYHFFIVIYILKFLRSLWNSTIYNSSFITHPLRLHFFFYTSLCILLLFSLASFLVPLLSNLLFFLFSYRSYNLLYIKSPVLAAAPDKLLPYFTQKNTSPGVLFPLKVLYFKLHQTSISKKAPYYYLHNLLTASVYSTITLLCYLFVVVLVHVHYPYICYTFFLLFSLYLKLPVLAAAPDKTSLRTLHDSFKVYPILSVDSFLFL